MNIREKLKLALNVLNYNLKIVFANKFIYFLIAAWLFFLIVIGIMFFGDGNPDIQDIYNVLIFPGILIMFYPVVYNIQSDKDTRMLEIIFGVPNYRYKVYLIRLVIALLLLSMLLLIMASFTWLTIIKIPIFQIVLQLMYPMFFLACLTFLFSTIVKNGNGTAVVMVIIGLIFFILADNLSKSKWNLFLNPFEVPSGMNLSIWANVVHQNRLMMMIGSIISILWGLTNLQQREKFVS